MVKEKLEHTKCVIRNASPRRAMTMVLNATFNTISFPSWWLDPVGEEALSHNAVSSKPRHQHDSNSQL